MSEIKVDTLTGKTSAGDITVTSEGGAATMQLQQGLAKAWAIIDTNTAATATTGSMNVSSVADNGTGDFTLAWATSMNATPYAFTQGVQNNSGDAYARIIGVRSTNYTQTTPAGMTTSNCRFVSIYVTNGAANAGYQGYSCIDIQGDLA